MGVSLSPLRAWDLPDIPRTSKSSQDLSRVVRGSTANASRSTPSSRGAWWGRPWSSGCPYRASTPACGRCGPPDHPRPNRTIAAPGAAAGSATTHPIAAIRPRAREVGYLGLRSERVALGVLDRLDREINIDLGPIQMTRRRTLNPQDRLDRRPLNQGKSSTGSNSSRPSTSSQKPWREMFVPQHLS